MSKKQISCSLIIILSLLIMLLAVPAMASASVSFVSQIPDGYTKSCSLCHTSAPALNQFGKDFKAAGNKYPSKTTTTTKPATTTTKPATTTTTTTKPATTTTTTKPAAPVVPPAPKGVLESEFVKMLNGTSSRAFTWTETPNAETTRERAAMLTIRMLGITDSATLMSNSAVKTAISIYKDADKATYPHFIALATKYSLVKGFLDATYRPQAVLNLSQAKILVERAKGYKTAQRTALWTDSGHNYVDREDYPGTRDGCVTCHDGEGFAKSATKIADVPNAGKNKISCTSCHSEAGDKIIEAGVAVTPNGNLTGGEGALCMTCHNSRRVISTLTPEKPSAPHVGPQAEVLFGIGGMTVEGVSYPNSPHSANPNTCVSCHGYRTEQGVTNHTFKADNAARACGSCHAGLDTVNRTALADYDGDGITEGIQDEVRGLQDMLLAAIKKAVGGNVEESHGAFAFTDAAGKAVVPTKAVYKAAWNHGIVENDKSEGVHNPAYVVKLLQQSYKELTGTDVPKAVIR